jgi:2-C-methyl-D-erythritol 4-phosphate cytidylyltransferase / 2-C-methyl-D-erythritol 2,4-cyclodiphosphate synthase
VAPQQEGTNAFRRAKCRTREEDCVVRQQPGSEPRIAALVVAAGRGSRAGFGVPKQYVQIAGRPVLRWALEALAGHPAAAPILAVIDPADRPLYDDAAAGIAGLLPPAAGGASRQASVWQGLEALEGHRPDFVLIHDAARPFPSPALLDRIVGALTPDVGVVPALPVADSLKRVDDGQVVGEVARDRLHAVQTPQAFPFTAILAAHRQAVETGVSDLSDDAAVAALAGLPVRTVSGERGNLKLTTAEDLAEAEARLAARQEWRTGQGFDVHGFGPGNHVMLCGVAVLHDGALIGHSDADVGLHALTDAVLGALGEGDIGAHFPPSDPEWRGATSDRFLADAAERVARRGGAIAHLDVTLICERPKIGPHREAMRARVAGIAGIEVGRVSIKATTSEGLGFTGRGEGIAAMAVATIRLPRP